MTLFYCCWCVVYVDAAWCYACVVMCPTSQCMHANVGLSMDTNQDTMLVIGLKIALKLPFASQSTVRSINRTRTHTSASQQ